MESAVAAPARLGSRISGRALRFLLWLAAAAALAVGLRLTVLRPARVPVTVFRAAAGRVEESVTNSKAGHGQIPPPRRALARDRRPRARAPGEEGRPCAPGRRPHADRRGRLPRAGRRPAERRSRRRCRRASRPAGRPSSSTASSRATRRSRARSSSRWSGSTSSRAGATRRRRPARRPGRGSARRGPALVAARVNLEKTVLRAPFDGVVAEVTTEVGEWITPSPPGLPIPPVIVLLDAGATYVSAPMDEVDVGKGPGRPAGPRHVRRVPRPLVRGPGHARRAVRPGRPGAEPRRSRSKPSSRTQPSRATLPPGPRPTSRSSSRRATACSGSRARRFSRATASSSRAAGRLESPAGRASA